MSDSLQFSYAVTPQGTAEGIPLADIPSVAKAGFAVGLRAALSQGSPGAWASDHLAETEKFTGWHYVAAHTIGKQLAQAEQVVYQDGANATVMKSRRKSLRWQLGCKRKSTAHGEQESATLPEDHRLSKLYKRPNPDQSGASLRYEAAIQLCLTGKCLIWKVRNRMGLTVERYVIPTAIAQPRPPSPELPRGGWYINPTTAYAYASRAMRDAEGYTEMRGYMRAIGAVLDARDVMVIQWAHPLYKDDSQSPVSAGAVWTDTSEKVDEARHSHLSRGIDASVIIGVDSEVDQSDLDRAAVKINEKYAGSSKAGSAILVTGGKEVTPITTAPKDMAYDLGFTQLRDAILALHAVSPISAGITDGGSYAAFVAALRQTVTLAVQPLCDLLAEEETEQQAREFGQGLTVEIEAVTLDDPAMLEAMLTTDASVGARTINEHRAERGLPPVPWGEERARAGGAAVGQPGMGQSPATPGDSSLSAFGESAGGESFPGEPGGEFGGLSRQQFKRNRSGLSDILTAVELGDISEVRAQAELEMIGVSPERAKRLIEDALDDGEISDPENLAAVEGFKSNGNGHRKTLTDDEWLRVAMGMRR